MKEFFIADPHIGHKNIAIYENRPDGWEDLLRENWNRVVAPDDFVWVLGDWALSNMERAAEYLASLNGKKNLIMGNHDKSPAQMVNVGFKEVFGSRKTAAKGADSHSVVHSLPVTSGKPFLVQLSHAPMHTLPPFVRANIHGHVHSKHFSYERPWHVNVSVEVVDYTPVSSEEIVSILAGRGIE